MRFELGLSLLVSMALLLCPTVAGATFYFHRGSSCSGTSLVWYNVGGYSCIAPSSGQVFPSVRLEGVPSGAKGQGYSSAGTCSAYAAEGGSGTYCLSRSSGFRAANWFWPYKKLVRAEPEPLLPPRFSVKYEARDLTTREVEIAARDIERAWKLVEEEDYEELSKYPTFIKG